MEKVKKLLSDHNNDEVNIYISYIKELITQKNKKGELKNPWAKHQKPEDWAGIYKKVAMTGLTVDGDTVILTFKGKLMPFYTYYAYKNLVLKKYPESKIDVQLVFNGDKYDFKKQSGKITYTHEIKDPFSQEKKLIGCYCIIKNRKGEFLELINKTDIENFRNSAKTQYIWKAWFNEMVYKSIMKRACKRHFKDLVKDVDKIDNENTNPNNAVINSDIQEKINATKNKDELGDIYKNNVTKDNKEQLIKIMKTQIEKIKKNESK